MVSTVIFRTLSLGAFLYVTVVICATSKSKSRSHTIFSDILEEERSSDYYEEDFFDIHDNYDSLEKARRNIFDSSDYYGEEGSGDDEKPSKSKTDEAISEKAKEILEDKIVRKIKFSNEAEKLDNDDIELISTTEDFTTSPEEQTTLKQEPRTDQTSPLETSTTLTFTPTQKYTTEITSTKSSISTQSQEETVRTTTISKPKTTVTTITKPKTTETTITTSNSYNCSLKDCDSMQVELVPNFQSILPGGNFFILCKTTSNVSLSEFKWYIENEAIPTRIPDANKVVLVQEAKIENLGKNLYICVVNDGEGCCENSASSVVLIYEKPTYWLHIAVLAGIALGLLFLICIPITVKLQRKYWSPETYKKSDQDTQPLTI